MTSTQRNTITRAERATGGTPTMAVRLRKEVSPDEGATWIHATRPPGPKIFQGTDPQFRYTVTNTGDGRIRQGGLVDSDLGSIAVDISLDPGESETFYRTGTWAPGRQRNIATVEARYRGRTVRDRDVSHYFGKRMVPEE